MGRTKKPKIETCEKCMYFIPKVGRTKDGFDYCGTCIARNCYVSQPIPIEKCDYV